MDNEAFGPTPEELSEMLSPTAVQTINQMTDDILNPEQFIRFFLQEVYGKPQPDVLPILKSFTEDVDGVILQLGYFKSSLETSHKDYKIEHEKDEKLTRMIQKLVASLRTEMEGEAKDGQFQSSMPQYVNWGDSNTRNYFEFSCTAKVVIGGMTGDALDPAALERFLLHVDSMKPNMKLLPMLRSFTTNVTGVITQLQNLRKLLLEAHKNYKNEHTKDENVIKRIKRLIENIEREQACETRQGRGQQSMRQYVKKEEN